MTCSTAPQTVTGSYLFFLDFMSGGVAGAFSKTIAAPLERIKLLLQTQSNNQTIRSPYSGILDCYHRCVREEGYFSLWRGNTVNLIRYFPSQALNFSFKHLYSSLFNLDLNSDRTRYVIGSFIAGGLAGCSSKAVIYPLDFARTRIGVDVGRKQFNGILDCLVKVFQHDGLRGLYRGLTVGLVGIFIYRSLYFGLYDWGKATYFNSTSLPDSVTLDLIKKYAFAQCVVMFSETVSYPTDTLKRMMMMQSARGEKTYKNSFECSAHLYKKGGIPIFFAGNASNLFRSFGSSLCLVMFDEIRPLLSQKALLQ